VDSRECSGATGRVILPADHSIRQPSLLELGATEFKEPGAGCLVGKVTDRVGLKWNINIGQQIEVRRCLNAIKVVGPRAKQNVGPYGRHHFIGVEDYERPPRLASGGIDEQPVASNDCAQIVSIAVVAEGLAIVASIFGNECGLKLRGELPCERRFPGAFWPEKTHRLALANHACTSRATGRA